MKRKRSQLGLGIFAIIVSTTFGFAFWQEVKSKKALEEQFRLARAEKIPTNATEFATLIQKADPSENAASYYRDFNFHRLRKGDSTQLATNLIFTKGADTLQEAESYLAKSSMALQILDGATKLPRCWFNRDWNEGSFVTLPEYSYLKEAAKLLALRGSVAAAKGDHKAAIGDVHKILVIAKHAREEPIAIGALVSESLEGMAIKYLAYWSFVDRDQSAYADAMKAAIDGLPEPNLKRENAGELFLFLSSIEDSYNPAYADSLGQMSDEIGTQEKLAAFFKNKSSARAEVISAQRLYYAALDVPALERKEAIDAARLKRNQALTAFPIVLRLFSESGDSYDSVAMREPNWEAKRQQYVALWRAIQDRKITESVETKDLLSPFDREPLSYRFDGKQITISVSGYERMFDARVLKVPPTLIQ